MSPDDKKYARIMSDDSVYARHLGKSNKYSDAIIADTTSESCDILVSEDQRLLSRFLCANAGKNSMAMKFSDFKIYLTQII